MTFYSIGSELINFDLVARVYKDGEHTNVHFLQGGNDAYMRIPPGPEADQLWAWLRERAATGHEASTTD